MADNTPAIKRCSVLTRALCVWLMVSLGASPAFSNDALSDNHLIQGNPALESYLQGLVNKAAKALRFSRQTLQVSIFNSLHPNAYALEEGTILVTSGLLMHMDDPNELYAVLAHEVAHISKKHHVKRLKHLVREALRQRRKYRSLSDEDKALFLLTINSQYSQKQELQADKQAIKALKKSGIPVAYYKSLLERLHILEQFEGSLLNYNFDLASDGETNATDEQEQVSLSSHPDVALRIAALPQPKKKPKKPREQSPLDVQAYRDILAKSALFRSNSPFLRRDHRLYMQNKNAYVRFPGGFSLQEATVDFGLIEYEKKVYHFQQLDAQPLAQALEHLLNHHWLSYDVMKQHRHHAQGKQKAPRLSFTLQSKLNDERCVNGVLLRQANVSFALWSQKEGDCRAKRPVAGLYSQVALEAASPQEVRQAFHVGVRYRPSAEPPIIQTFSYLDDSGHWLNSTNDQREQLVRVLH